MDGEAELMRFVVRNIRAISPLRWDLNSGQGVLTQFDNGTVGSRPQIVNDSGTAPADLSQLPPEELRKLKGQSLPAPSQPKLVLPESSSVKKKSGELRLAPAVPLARSNVVVTPQEVPTDQPSRVSVTPSPTSPADNLFPVTFVSPVLKDRTTFGTLQTIWIEWDVSLSPMTCKFTVVASSHSCDRQALSITHGQIRLICTTTTNIWMQTFS